MSKPVKNIKVGKIDIAMWQNDYNGNPSFSFTIQKSYLEKNSKQWKQTNSFALTDLRDIADGIMFIRQQGIAKKNSQPIQLQTSQTQETPANFANAVAEDQQKNINDNIPF